MKEADINYCLRERTERIRNFPILGPPDLVSLSKYNSSQKQQTVCTFLYCTGVDTTSSSSIAAYLNSVANVIGASPQIWFGKPKNWKVTQATYCVFNAFSKVDLRVTVHIPGKVEIAILDARGELIPESERLWLETFACSVIRALLSDTYDDDELNPVVECRALNPFDTIGLARQFMDAYETLFFEAPKLGCDVDVQIPTLISNYFTDCFLKCVELTNEFNYALEILERLRLKDSCVSYLIAKINFMKDHEVEAVQVLYNAIKLRPRDANLLMLQAEYCIEKENYQLALSCAIQAIRALPSEFKPWAILVKVYTLLSDYENALLSLNSSPMFPHREKFHLRRVIGVTPDVMHLPLPMDVTLEEVTSLNSQDVAAEHEAVDPNLLNLPAANLKSTFAIAYDLLTGIVHRTGWEQLLKYRAKVFVMEEEYRKDKNKSVSKNSSRVNVSNIDELKNVDGSTASLPHSHSINDEEVSILEAFKKKRLCERWLDNLFMLLYEDLRAFKMWQAEFIHFQSQRLIYSKNTLEWELLGSIAYRLHNYKEAAGAFINALSGRFSIKSTKKLLEYYKMEKTKLVKQSFQLDTSISAIASTPNAILSPNGKNKKVITPAQISKKIQSLDEKILDCIVKLLVWDHRWYREFDSVAINSLKEIIGDDGIVKIESQIQAVYATNKNGIAAVMDDSFKFLKSVKSFGSSEDELN